MYPASNGAAVCAVGCLLCTLYVYCVLYFATNPCTSRRCCLLGDAGFYHPSQAAGQLAELELKLNPPSGTSPQRANHPTPVLCNWQPLRAPAATSPGDRFPPVLLSPSYCGMPTNVPRVYIKDHTLTQAAHHSPQSHMAPGSASSERLCIASLH
jgi:hypothetical protein